MIFSYVYDSTRVFEIFKHTNSIYGWLNCIGTRGCVHLHSYACYTKCIKNIQIRSLLQLQINLPIPCDFIGITIRNGAEHKAERHGRSMEYVRIFNCWVDSNSMCAFSSSVYLLTCGDKFNVKK